MTKNLTPIRSGSVLIFTTAFAIVALLAWAHWAKIDQITRAPGQVIASSRNQVIQAQDGGTVEEMRVKEGARVKRGEVLLRFDKAKVEAAYLESLSKTASLEATVARLKVEVFGGKLSFPAELDTYPEIKSNQEVLLHKRQSAIRDEISALEKARALVNDELNINLPLEKTGDVSKTDIIRLQRQAVEIQGQITNRRNKYMQDSQTDLSKAQEDLDVAQQVLAQRKDQLDHMEVVSPVDGIVRNVRITTRGGVAKPGEEIMQIVPLDDDLLIEVKVSTRDIGFIKPGLPVTIKLDAFDYTIYGTLHGTVSYISADTLNDENRSVNEKPFYRVEVKSAGKNFTGQSAARIEIQPGMTASVEIKTGENSVLNYLAKPITKTLSESLNER